MSFKGFLRQSTAATLKAGPFVDSTNGKDLESGLTLAQADCRLAKNGGDMAQKNDSSSATYDERGKYDVPANTTDTNTVGILELSIDVSGALFVEHSWVVLPPNVYDSLIAGSDALDVSLIQWLGTAPLALTSQRVETLVGAMAANVINAAAINDAAITAAKINDGAFTAAKFASGAFDAVWTVTTRTLSAFGFAVDISTTGLAAIWDRATSALTTVGSIGRLLVDNINATISSRLAAASYTTPPTAAANADAVLEELIADHSSVGGSLAERLSRLPNVASGANGGLPLQGGAVPNANAGANGGLPTVDASNRIAGMQGTIHTLDELDAAQDAQHATTQTAIDSVPTNAEFAARTLVAADYATAAAQATAQTSLNTIDDFLNTEIAAIIAALATAQADLDDIQTRLPATLVSGRMDSNMSAINNSSAAAVRQALAAGQIVPGTVDNAAFSPTTTQLEASNITDAAANHYLDRVIIFTSGTLAGQVVSISAYALNAGRGRFTFSTATSAPANGTTFVVV